MIARNKAPYHRILSLIFSCFRVDTNFYVAHSFGWSGDLGHHLGEGRKEGRNRGNCVGLVRVAVVADEWRELKDRMAMGGR